jgi:hypothetical protein
VSGNDLVYPVDERREPAGAKKPAERAGEPDLAEQNNAPATVPRDRRAVTENDPPALPSPLFGYAGEQPAGFLVREREQGAPRRDDPGDDPRRPSAELSLSGTEQGRPL